MKKIIFALVLLLAGVSCWGQSDGKMWFMGVPVEGTVENFERGLAKRWNVKDPQTLKVDAQWATKTYIGSVNWLYEEPAVVRVTYNPSLNLVWLVSLEFENIGVYEIPLQGAVERYNFIKRLLKERFPEVVPASASDYKCKFREGGDDNGGKFARWSFNEGLIVLSLEKAIGAGFGPDVDDAYRVKVEVISTAGRKAALGK